MKRANRQRQAKKSAPAVLPRSAGITFWRLLGGLAVATLLVFLAYEPAIGGPFLFDDLYLPFDRPDVKGDPLKNWIGGVRPMLAFTFWVNYRLSGAEPFWYHVVNLLFHLANAVLVFFLVRKTLEWAAEPAPRRELLAAFACGLFLLHPLQTEAVAYVASRSDVLSTLFCYVAAAVFFCRRSSAISFQASALVLICFAGAVLSKEQAAILPVWLVVTDYFWNPGFSIQGARRNWRLHFPMAAAGLFGVAFVWKQLAGAGTAGFAVKGLPWHDYFFTQCRVVWMYVRLFLLPYGQNLDPDVPISRSLLEHGAVIGLAALVAVVVATWWFRRRYPLACYGALVFLLLLAPTSSFVPIVDPLAERRVYLPSIGLLFVAVELARQWKTSRAALVSTLAAVLVVAGWLTYRRNHVWGSAVALWEDSVSKSPRKTRPRFQLADAYYRLGRCAEAVQNYQKAADLEPPDHRLLVNWALAFDCSGRPIEALAKLTQAAALEKSAHVYSMIGMVHAKQGKGAEALEALDVATKLDPRFKMAYVYRGNVYAGAGELVKAAAEFRRALEIDPYDTGAREGLAMAEQQLRQNR